jgi:phosphoglycerol transferase MdoB-like AlkP superfamily enzyme
MNSLKTPKPLLVARMAFPLAASLITVLLGEWIARGALTVDTVTSFIFPHAEAYLLAWLFLFLVWLLLDWIFRLPPLSTLGMAVLGCVPCAVNFYTLQLRGEPFLPWDLAQVSEAAGVASAAGIKIQTSMIVTVVVELALMAGSFFLYRGRHKQRWLPRVAGSAATAAALCLLIFGVYLQPAVCQAIGIVPDAWMQDRYYRYYGVVTGFMTNLSNLEIDKPDNYSEETVDAILDNVDESRKFSTSPLYPTSYAATTAKDEQVKKPTIIYVMNESYWDVSELEQYGIKFDTDVSANLHALQQTSAYGRAYSPSFGGGTCDVEFEALTGYSASFLPSGSKPYQQHVTKPMFALPSYLKTQGYQTAAVHCFWAKYWSRDTAYPNLGLDDFISLEDMHGVTKVRKHYWTNGLVTDDSMADQIIGQYEKMKASSDEPVFLHAVTMQNHTNYNKDNYPDDQRVKVLEHPAGMKASTVGALEDFATGIRDADAMLGKLTAYFSQVGEPVILVFWGDHYNPIDSNYDVYTTTGYASDSSADPRLHQTTLLLWSNYSDAQVDLGTIAAYDISPVMMNLYGLQQPLYFQFLNRQLRVASRACTRGVTMNLDGTTTLEPTEFQQRWTQEHWMLQYDLMFGKGYALTRMGLESVAEPAKGK